MARPTALTPDELDEAVASLPGWSVEGSTLRSEFSFADFAEAFGFMAAAATVAAELDHHPDWSNVYSKVTVQLSTHDVGAVTELDVKLATRMNALARRTT